MIHFLKRNKSLKLYISAKEKGLYLKGLPYREKYLKSLQKNHLAMICYNCKKYLRYLYTFKHTYSKLYKNLIKGKKICIVGPLKGCAGDGFKIDSFDIVVRCNQWKKNKKNLNYKGTKTSIIYFNGQFGDEFLKKNRNTLFNNEVLYCFKFGKKGLYDLKRFHGKYRFFDSRITKEEKPQRFLGSAQLIPLIVNDLLRHEAKLIYIFHADLLLSPLREKNYYPKKYSHYNKLAAALTNSGSHDAVSSFVYLKRIYEKKRLTGDSKFIKAIQLSLKDYCKKMESKYKFAQLH